MPLIIHEQMSAVLLLDPSVYIIQEMKISFIISLPPTISPIPLMRQNRYMAKFVVVTYRGRMSQVCEHYRRILLQQKCHKSASHTCVNIGRGGVHVNISAVDCWSETDISGVDFILPLNTAQNIRYYRDLLRTLVLA